MDWVAPPPWNTQFHPKKAIRFSTLKYMDQEWMVNIPLYAISTLQE